MSKREQVALRDKREPGHLWADNEIFDVFGDALGPNGIVVYMVLARYAYGTTVKLSLRELAGYARVGKDTVSRSLKVMLAMGLIVETEAVGKVRTVRQFSLANVKKLAVGYQAAKAEVVDHSGPRLVAPICRMERQNAGAEEALGVSAGETELSQMEGNLSHTAANLSHTAEPCYRQDTRHKTQDNTPLPPEGVGEDGLTAGEREAWDLECIFAPKRAVPRPAPTLAEWVALSVRRRAEVAAAEEAKRVAEWNTPRAVRARIPLVLPGASGPGEANYAMALTAGASWVAKHAPFGDEPRTRTALVDALRGLVESEGLCVEQAARLALERWAEVHEMAAAGLLAHAPWGPKKFYLSGAWRRPGSWTVDRQARDARVGMR